MTYEDIDDFEQIDPNNDETIENEHNTLTDIDKDAQVRKRIDDLLEKKRLKELLDDTDDW